MREQGAGYLSRPSPSGLADVVEIVLDKGVVIDAYVRVSLLGVELLTLDARIVVASVDTYLRAAEAVNRLDVSDKGGKNPLDMLTEGAAAATEKVAASVVEGKVEGVVGPAKRVVGGAVGTVADVAEGVADKADELVGKTRSDD